MSKSNEGQHRTINVTGNGNFKEKPDYTEVDFSLDTKSKDYEKALRQGSTQLNNLRLSLQEAGFQEDALKTRNFDINTLYHTVYTDKKGNSKEVFDGYKSHYSLRLGFNIDMKLLAKGLAVISQCPSHPKISVNFKIKDTTPLELVMLKSAGEDARAKADILCEAAGGKLGKLIKINYDWGRINSYSKTSCDLDDFLGIEDSIGCRSVDNYCATLENLFPEDVEESDSANFIWEIE